LNIRVDRWNPWSQLFFFKFTGSATEADNTALAAQPGKRTAVSRQKMNLNGAPPPDHDACHATCERRLVAEQNAPPLTALSPQAITPVAGLSFERRNRHDENAFRALDVDYR